MTTSSLRLAKWLAEYAALMRLIGSEAGRVWSGMAELFELYFLHTFHTFGDITILELTSPQVQRQVSTLPSSEGRLWYCCKWTRHWSSLEKATCACVLVVLGMLPDSGALFRKPPLHVYCKARN